MRFWKKPDKVKVGEVIEIKVQVVQAEAMHIKRTGSYVLQLQNTLPAQECAKIVRQLHQQTGAKWVVVQGGAKVMERDK